jgi:hypothetical protein
MKKYLTQAGKKYEPYIKYYNYVIQYTTNFAHLPYHIQYGDRNTSRYPSLTVYQYGGLMIQYRLIDKGTDPWNRIVQLRHGNGGIINGYPQVMKGRRRSCCCG